jgi:Putative beta-barrel porin-2, OmpL-like. bbp2
MHDLKKKVTAGTTLACTILGLGVAAARLDQAAAQAPPAATPPATTAPPAAGTPPAPGAPAPAPAPAPAAPAAPTSPLIGPSITGPLTIQLPPPKWNLPLIGTVYFDGIGSGLGQWQNNPFPSNRAWQPDLSNGQFFLQKTDGVFQFYTQFGAYSIAALGAPYISAAQATFGVGGVAASGNLWGWFPVGYAKIAPNDSLNFEGGKLPTLIGAEYTFSFENINIERGLLWNQEPAISKGGQVNYTKGPLAFSLQFGDGFDSGVYNWLEGAVTWTINSANSLEFVGGGNVGKTDISTLRTPLPQSNSQIYNLIYTYNNDPWIIQPYFQATHVASAPSLGWTNSASTFGFAVLGNYDLSHGFNLGGRLEYIGSTGNVATSPNLLYGPGSGAFSLTITPSYQWKYYFARAEFSWVKANSVVTGLGLGPNADGDSQTRVMIETGILF